MHGRVRRAGVWIGVLVVTALSGCAGSGASRQAATDPQPMPERSTDQPGVESLIEPRDGRPGVAGHSVEGRPIEYEVVGGGSRVVLVLGGIHGSEPAGVPLVRRLAAELRADPDRIAGATVVLVAAANPDGLERGQRTNVRDVDLNRNFPASNFRQRVRHGIDGEPEPETRALLRLLERYRPQRLISIHQPLNCIDYDGPGGRELAAYLATFTDLPVRRLGSRPGSLGSYAGIDLGVPVITVELPRRGIERLSDDELWERYGPMMLASVDHPDVVARHLGGTSLPTTTDLDAERTRHQTTHGDVGQ